MCFLCQTNFLKPVAMLDGDPTPIVEVGNSV